MIKRRCLGEIMESSSRVIGDLYGKQRNVLFFADNSKINADISMPEIFCDHYLPKVPYPHTVLLSLGKKYRK